MKVVNIDSYRDIEGATYVQLYDAPAAMKAAREADHNVVMVSTPIDYGLCYQEEHTLPMDMKKNFCLNFEHYAEVMGDSTGMQDVLFTPRCTVEHCDKRQEYSVKIDTWTHCTIDFEIPDNVTWFLPNCNINHPRIVKIPFGLNSSTEDDYVFNRPFKETLTKKHELYLNFSEHTFQRKMMNIRFSEYDWAEVITKEDANKPGISHEEYMHQLESHLFTLCPVGVGLDSFRIWESIFVGSIPVLERDHWNEWMEGLLPVILVDDFYKIESIDYLLERQPKVDFDSYLISEEYWVRKIIDAI